MNHFKPILREMMVYERRLVVCDRRVFLAPRPTCNHSHTHDH